MASFASQSSQALSTIALRTGSTSVGEEAITLRILLLPGLIDQRLGEVAGLRLHLLEQSHVADRNHRLVREGLQQGNLLVAERVHVDAAKHDRPYALALAQQRYAQDRAKALLSERLSRASGN